MTMLDYLLDGAALVFLAGFLLLMWFGLPLGASVLADTYLKNKRVKVTVYALSVFWIFVVLAAAMLWAIDADKAAQ